MSMKVLIVDADWRFVDQVSAFLESHAHLVVHNSAAAGVIEKARRWKPDLAIVSEESARGDLLEQLHALGDRPAVLLVGWMDRFERLWRAWQHGGDELLVKPVYSVAEIHTAIVTALENAATGVRARPIAASA